MRLFLYFSEILNRKVLDKDSKPVGKLYDLSMRLESEVFPRASAAVIVRGVFQKEYVLVDLDDFSVIGEDGIRLKKPLGELAFQKERIRPGFSLAFDILDQQVVDVHGQKVVRVNDVHLLRVDRQIYLAHVDVGLRGIVRRLEWDGFVDPLVKLFSPKSDYLTQEQLLSWKNSQVLTLGNKRNVLKMKEAGQKLAKIPPSELADIMEDLDVFEKVSMFKSFSVDLQRQVFTDMIPNEKEELLDQLNNKEAANLLENIPADEATDLLNEVTKEKRMQWLRLMQTKTSKELRKLLGFAQDSAGGLMTTEYISMSQDALVKDALEKIKREVNSPINLYHIYIVDKDQRLIGMTSLRRFIAEDPEKPLTETCFDNNMFVRTDDDVEEVAILLEKYKFSSIPVLDENDIMQGVITSDDVMEELISLIWKKYKGEL